MKQNSSRPSLLAFLIISAFAIAFLAAALVLGTEPRLRFERSPGNTFRVTATNQFAGVRFFTKTIDGVTQIVSDNAVRDGRRDTQYEYEKRKRQKHLDIFGRDGARLGWDRESDQSLIEGFMNGKEAALALTDRPPWWRMTAAWLCAGLGALTFLGAIQSTFFAGPPAATSKLRQKRS